MIASEHSGPKHTHTFRVMGGPAEIQLEAVRGNSTAQMQELCAAMEQEALRLEVKYSRYRTDSVIAQLQQVAESGGSTQVDEETAALISFCDAAYRSTRGVFDITSGILRKHWQFEAGATPPSDAMLQETLQLVGWNNIRWRAPTISFLQRNIELDLGGVVKEYAVDRLVGMAVAAGVSRALVNLAGDIAVHARADTPAWRIGIVDPDAPEQALLHVELRSGACVTSGDYERFFIADGIRHYHILNPRTGRCERHYRSVTVLGPSATAAGVAATAGMIIGESILRELRVKAVCIDATRQIQRLGW